MSNQTVASAAARLDLSGAPLYALTAMLLLAFAAVVAMPFNISGIVQSFGISNGAAGLVASTELAAISLASLFVARAAGRLSPRRIYAVGISAIVIANLLTVFANDIPSIMVLRAIAGLGAGSVTDVSCSAPPARKSNPPPGSGSSGGRSGRSSGRGSG
mgnify:CR=1 FL=1